MNGPRIIALLGACVVAASVVAQEEGASTLTFGVYSFKRPTDVYSDFTVAIDELNRLLAAQANKPVMVDLRVFKTYDECLERFVAGEVDFVRVGPASYVLAKQRKPEIQLLAAEREEGDAPGLIVVRSDSAMRTLADLKGRRFAFGDENSTIGRYLAQALLVQAGVHAEDLKAYAYLDRHDKVYAAVEIGDYDAGALHAATFRELDKNGKLRVIARFANVGKPWIARAGLDGATVAALRQALLSLQQKETLEALKITGLQRSTDTDFDFVREGMKRAQEFARPLAKPAPGK